MFQLKKVVKGRKRLEIITRILFSLFQLNLRYKENRKDYGIEIFEHFYLPWRTNEEFNEYFKKIEGFTLNPKSRIYTLYNFSKHYLNNETTYVEVGCWKGGASGMIALANSEKDVDYYLCDTFSGVKNSSDKDSFFKDNEYNDATIEDVKKIEEITSQKFNIVEGIFPNSISEVNIRRPISLAHIDVDTYISAKESFEFISSNSVSGSLIILDDYGGWFTDGVTTFGNEILKNIKYFAVPNHLGQLLIFKK